MNSNLHIVFSVDGYEVISANAKKRCINDVKKRTKGKLLILSTCKERCDKEVDCKYFAFVSYAKYNACKTYVECDESSLEDADSHQAIYKKIEGKQNKWIVLVYK